MRYVLVLSVVLMACAPSKAEVAIERCRSDFSGEKWKAAEISCKEALLLSPKDAATRDRFTRATMASAMADFDAAARITAAQREATALEDQARLAEREAFRRRLDEH